MPAMDMTNPAIEEYVRGLLDSHDEPVLLEMEAEARERGFPIVGRMCGVVIEILARSVGAKRVFELGSGYGYSAYWFARATGPDGEVHLTDGDPGNEAKALDYLGRAGLGTPITFHVGDAVTTLQDMGGEWDVIYCDIDKDGYPDAWAAARDRIRPGGLYICDNAIQAGGMNVATGEDRRGLGWTEAVRRHNDAVMSDERFLATILPIRDGVMVAVRTP
jgi:caffeoyl-CoA O-methyltransferase